MIFRNILLGAVFVAATAFAQPADSTTNQSSTQLNTASFSTGSVKTVASLKKEKKVVKPVTTWSKIKDLFE